MGRKSSTKNGFFQSSIADFLKKLGSESASPGGGSAAALMAATGVSLVEMVARINEKRMQKKTHQKTPGAKLRIDSLVETRRRLIALIKLDMQAFEKLSRFSKEQRSESSYEEALRTATEPPFEMAQLTYEAMMLGEAEIGRTSRWLASDLAEAGIILEASFQSAQLNVGINLKSIQDSEFVGRIKGKLGQLENKISASKMRLLEVLQHD